MLDTKTTFDDVVVRNAGSPQQAQAILDNRLYRNISGALGGTQEYMAMEKLYELYRGGRFDLIVVDTPPTRHALDFLDAPGRLLRFLNNRIFRLLMVPTRAGLRAINVATRVLLRTISRVVGGAMVADAVAFFAAFEGMEQGFRDRAAKVEELLVNQTTAFVVVATPRRDAVEEALFFADRLRESSGRVEALVVNRMFPHFGPVPAALAQAAETAGSGEIAALVANLSDLDRVARREEQHVTLLTERLPGASVVRVPYLADDVHDVGGLTEVGRWLFGSARTRFQPGRDR
jgi:anion-transporting  ArsA/GET3 family ATPase